MLSTVQYYVCTSPRLLEANLVELNRESATVSVECAIHRLAEAKGSTPTPSERSADCW